mmetsp:Transcript_11938/g.25665  ORF Transcript_11938/g.25665 Transcript_11938/m.25665 type:complete len:447 (-) Transcript_11938:176-1516(-)|eukprot:CAMPEP_0202903586 /NCGR_PEP_ID=MMETSP1392-20130828/25243_1 /ASSEMBLY_ACC=CAM_ASM_000868 /TAXON_ID=225041 /ORGANISM="Chlamydomonas chlamydogama, Strain SAG 11-48b" /LENGTH=446 /DNA_ID=CAMNT_0049590835 /DNA_START=268 /DNA_END=1608 /DNA_ORIENTATION=-
MDDLLKFVKGKAVGGSDAAGGSGMPGLSSLLGDELKGADMAQLQKQAETLWKFLDDLAESDPEAYKNFLNKQAEGVKKQAASEAPPGATGGELMHRTQGSLPALLLVTGITGSSIPAQSIGVLHIWKAADGIPEATVTSPSGTATPITASTASWQGVQVPLGPSRQPLVTTDKAGVTVHSFHLALGPATAQLAVLGTPPVLRMVVAEAACQMVEAKHQVKLGRQGMRLKVAAEMLPAEMRSQIEGARVQDALQSAARGTSAEGLSSGLLSQLSGLSMDPAQRRDTQGTSSSAAAAAAASHKARSGPGGKAKAPLIVDMSASASASDLQKEQSCAAPAETPGPVPGSDSGAPALVSGPTTSEQPTIKASVVDGSGGQQVVVEAYLSAASSAHDMDVEVDGTRLVLTVAGHPPCSMVLPCDVDDGKARAKFDAKRRVLTVKFPVAVKQ